MSAAEAEADEAPFRGASFHWSLDCPLGGCTNDGKLFRWFHTACGSSGQGAETIAEPVALRHDHLLQHTDENHNWSMLHLLPLPLLILTRLPCRTESRDISSMLARLREPQDCRMQPLEF